MKIRLLPANEYRRERWKNGLGWTREIVRYPSDAERKSGVAYLSNIAGTNRNNRGQELAWTLYNKVDFIFNY